MEKALALWQAAVFIGKWSRRLWQGFKFENRISRLMTELSPDLDAPIPLTSLQWFFKGTKVLASVPAVILVMSFVGFGGLTAQAGMTAGEAMLLAVSTWALPSAVVVVGAIINKVPFYATVFAVILASVRLMPMTMALVPILRGPKTRTWHLLVASNFVAVTAWVFAMNRLPDLPREGRLPYFLGLGSTLAFVNMLVTGLSHSLSASLPPVAAASLQFLTPIYFLVSMSQAARLKTEYLAILLGLCLAPLLHVMVPETDLLWCGLIGGTIAYLAGKFLDRPKAGAQ